jgi:hypothetical protein
MFLDTKCKERRCDGFVKIDADAYIIYLEWRLLTENSVR